MVPAAPVPRLLVFRLRVFGSTSSSGAPVLGPVGHRRFRPWCAGSSGCGNRAGVSSAVRCVAGCTGRRIRPAVARARVRLGMYARVVRQTDAHGAAGRYVEAVTARRRGCTRFGEWFRRLNPWVVDGVLAALSSSSASPAPRGGARCPAVDYRAQQRLLGVAVLATSVPFVVRRRAPLAVLLVGTASLSLLVALGHNEGLTPFFLWVAAVTVGADVRRPRRPRSAPRSVALALALAGRGRRTGFDLRHLRQQRRAVRRDVHVRHHPAQPRSARRRRSRSARRDGAREGGGGAPRRRRRAAPHRARAARRRRALDGRDRGAGIASGAHVID